jgi:hypothetical protein
MPKKRLIGLVVSDNEQIVTEDGDLYTCADNLEYSGDIVTNSVVSFEPAGIFLAINLKTEISEFDKCITMDCLNKVEDTTGDDFCMECSMKNDDDYQGDY